MTSHRDSSPVNGASPQRERTALQAASVGGKFGGKEPVAHENSPAAAVAPPARPQPEATVAERDPSAAVAVGMAAHGGDNSRSVTGMDRLFAGVALFAAGAWVFQSTILELAATWDRQADYSHGWLVTPVALLILWLRRDRRPGPSNSISWAGLVPIALAMGCIAAGIRFSLTPLAGWAITLWVSGACWLVLGWRTLRWAAPAIAFLLFMVPLPYSLEHQLSGPLQGVATVLSSWMLQCMGMPAVSSGNTIHMGEFQFDVVEACSGLRMLVGISALTYVLIVATRRPVWTKVALVLFTIPAAVLANSLRIAATGAVSQIVSGEAAHNFSHDVAGWLMIPTAAAILGILLWYLGRLIVPVASIQGKELLGDG